jgi:hypothetical protein
MALPSSLKSNAMASIGRARLFNQCFALSEHLIDIGCRLLAGHVKRDLLFDHL